MGHILVLLFQIYEKLFHFRLLAIWSYTIKWKMRGCKRPLPFDSWFVRTVTLFPVPCSPHSNYWKHIFWLNVRFMPNVFTFTCYRRDYFRFLSPHLCTTKNEGNACLGLFKVVSLCEENELIMLKLIESKKMKAEV